MQGSGTSLDQIIDFNLYLADDESNTEEQKWREYWPPLASASLMDDFSQPLQSNLVPLPSETDSFGLRSLDILNIISSHQLYLNNGAEESMLFFGAEQHCSPAHLLEPPVPESVPDFASNTSAQSTPVSLASDIPSLCSSPSSSASSELSMEPYEEGISAPGSLLALPTTTSSSLYCNPLEITSTRASTSSLPLPACYLPSFAEDHEVFESSSEEEYGFEEPASQFNPTKEKLQEKRRKAQSRSSPIQAKRAPPRRRKNATKNADSEYTPDKSGRGKSKDTSSRTRPLYSCTACKDLVEGTQTFTRISDLRRHQRESCKALANSENKPTCQDCGKLLSRSDAVKRHLENSCTARKLKPTTEK
ncbi:hypothetical protein NP233_g3190 [Leucocoprinus birnbaumii]|uniref:Uncharacterized protein n=1 Tax=Leucocoprinus birnbaumii TaxID=56174 RepID=A0AAD5VZR4_9AGAR|nr:hypothetical protein NP233_g3190 [Leucocoprinus birnbaumii]